MAAQPGLPLSPLLRVEGLTVAFPGAGGGWVPVVRDLDLVLERGEMVGLVGESGCGKTLTALSLVRLLPPRARILAGQAWLAPAAGRDEPRGHGGDGGSAGTAAEDLLAMPEGELRRRRGSRVGFVFQEPMTALNPVMTIGAQLVEALQAHRPASGERVSRRLARREAAALLDRVALPDAGRRLDAYPHELSGGQRQRVVIALALAGGPDLLLADEPTTALDVTVQAQILDLLARLREELGLTVLLITHDLAVVAETCERVVVMYAGQVVEDAPVESLFRRPGHPYAAALLAALPRLGRPVPRGELPTVPGRVPDPAALPSGCAFHPRCPQAMEVCRQRQPDLRRTGHGGGSTTVGRARCFLHGELPGPSSGAGEERRLGGAAEVLCGEAGGEAIGDAP